MKALIVDDETPAREYLLSLFSGFPQLEVIGEAADGLTALQMVEELKPDVVFLDIRMPGLNGLEVAQQLSLRESPPRIVFITAYDEHALEAFESEAVDYLVKPCTTKRLKKAIEKLERRPAGNLLDAVQKIGQKSLQKLALLHETKKIRLMIAWEDIIFLTSRNEKTYVMTERGELRAMENLGSLAAILPETFCRTHRSYVVNLERVEQIQPWGNGAYNLVLRGVKEMIPLSRGYAKEFKESVNWV